MKTLAAGLKVAGMNVARMNVAGFVLVAATAAAEVSVAVPSANAPVELAKTEPKPMHPPVGPEHAHAMLWINFQALDCENQGVIEVGEVDDHFAQVWLPADRDSDQQLSPREYRRTHKPLSVVDEAAMFADADRDGNGHVSHGEMRKHLMRLILLLDKDSDSEVTAEEAGVKSGADRHTATAVRRLDKRKS